MRVYEDFDLLITIRSRNLRGSFNAQFREGSQPYSPQTEKKSAVPRSKTLGKFVESTCIIKDTMGLDTVNCHELVNHQTIRIHAATCTK